MEKKKIFKITEVQLEEVLEMLNSHRILKARSLLKDLELIEEEKQNDTTQKIPT